MTRDLETVIDDVHFRFDGDLEIDIGSGRMYGTWDGHYFNRADAVKIRDFLNQALGDSASTNEEPK